jgi:formylmethanofuran dehydrogenase subunit E
MNDLQALLRISADRHSHLCPRQVLGVRAALAGAAALNLDIPRRDKRLFIIVETDGCFVDGVEVATGVSIGHRTLRVEDLGKIAATFVDVKNKCAIRVAPRHNVRSLAWDYTPGEKRHYFSQLNAYQVMPIDELFTIEVVELVVPIAALISRPGIRTECHICGEEIINEREVFQERKILCRTCAGGGYYTQVSQVTENHKGSVIKASG